MSNRIKISFEILNKDKYTVISNKEIYETNNKINLKKAKQQLNHLLKNKK